MTPPYLCLFSATLSSSQTSVVWVFSSECSPHSCSAAKAWSGPTIRARHSTNFSTVIWLLQSAEPLIRLKGPSSLPLPLVFSKQVSVLVPLIILGVEWQVIGSEGRSEMAVVGLMDFLCWQSWIRNIHSSMVCGAIPRENQAHNQHLGNKEGEDIPTHTNLNNINTMCATCTSKTSHAAHLLIGNKLTQCYFGSLLQKFTIGFLQ